MENHMVGYRFAPTGEELINHYLKNKILGKSWLVDDAISEINICSYEPMCLPSLSQIKSNDPVWYFFSRKEFTSAKKKVIKRTTNGGYWKATGVDRKIKDRRGNRGEIGLKKTLVYYEGRVPNGIWTPWVMHEYHITCLPLHQRNYVICQVMYKGEDEDITSGGNNSTEPSQSSMVSDSNTYRNINTQPEVNQPCRDNYYGLSMSDLSNPVDPLYHVQDDDEFLSGLKHVNRGQVEYLFSDQEFAMQEDYNRYRPKKPLSGIFLDYSSDAESISATSYEELSSPGESVGYSTNTHFQSYRDETLSPSLYYSKDLQAPAKTFLTRKTRETHLKSGNRSSKQEVKQSKSSRAINASSSMMKTMKKKGLFITTEEMMEKRHKKPKYVYVMNMFIGFILLVAVIGDILSVFFKT